MGLDLRVAALAASLFFVAGSAHAGGWTQPSGEYYAKAWWRSLVGVGAFDTDGEIVELPDTYLDQALNLYAEYGLAESLTLVAFANPYGYARYGDASTSYVGLLSGGLRYGVALGETRLAVEGHYGYAPDLGEEDLAPSAQEGLAHVYIPTVGTRRVEGELQLGHPLSFGWTAASVGYRWHSREGLDPALYGFAQLGWNASPAVVLDLHLNVLEALGEIEIVNVAGAGQTRYFGYGVGASWWLTDAFALNAGLEGVFYAASNAATPTVTAGVEVRPR